MARTTAVPRTLKLLRGEGFVVDVAEAYNAFSGQRKDLFGWMDLVAYCDQYTVGVQVCGTDVSEHVRKMMGERKELIESWLRGPFREAILIGWRKVLKKRGGVQKVFKPRIFHFYLDPFCSGTLQYRELKDVEGTTIREIVAGADERRPSHAAEESHQPLCQQEAGATEREQVV